MRMYECHICGSNCDPGELENGVCFDCRVDAIEKQEVRTIENIKMWNQAVRRYKQQSDGQMVMSYGK